MNLPFLKKENREYFLALLLRDEKVTAVIFEEFQKKIGVVAEHEEYFADSIEDATIDEWLDVLDKAISTAEEKLPENAELSKTIFGVTEQWVEDTKIKKEYLSKLKHISDSLRLSPIGFLVIHEAITHLLKQEEGAPVSGILTEVGKQSLVISLLRGGKVIETRTTRIEDTVSQTVDKLLQHFTTYEVLPSRIILLNREDSDSLSQEFISHSWSKSLPFLHVPQITILPKSFDARAIIYGAATQMGFEVLGDEKAERPVTHPGETILPKTEALSEKEETPEPHGEDQKEQDPTAQPSAVHGPLTTAEDLGFVLNKDIRTEGPHTTPPVQHTEYAIAHPVAPPPTHHPVVASKEHLSQHQNVVPVQAPEAVAPKPKGPGITQRIGSIFSPLTKLGVPSIPGMRIPKNILFIPPILILLAIGAFAAYAFGVKATVTLDIQPKVIEQDQNVTFSTNGSSDFTQDLLEAKTINATKDGQATTNTTGKKEVGDKAKGTVTLYSRFTKETTFPAGTPISGPNNLEFTTDKEVKVASSSADASASPSTVKVAVTAKKIGKESNLPSNSKFKVGTYDESDVVAKNDQAFSGGSKQEVTVVSQKDIDTLLKDLPKQVEDSAKDELSKQLASDEVLLPVLVHPTLSKKDFDKNVGEEAKQVTLKATVSLDGIAYKKQTLADYADAVLQDRKQDLTISKEGISTQVKDVSEKNDTDVTATVHIKANLLPKIDEQKLTKELAGKTFDEAKNILSKLPQVSGVNVELRPSLSFLPRVLPKLAKNIVIVTHQ